MATRKVKWVPPARAIATVLRQKSRVSSGEVAELAGISRQAAHRHLQEMVRVGKLFAEGRGRAAHYVERRTHVTLVRARAGLDEARLYAEVEAEFEALRTLPEVAARIVHYAFTELVNNAIDHSGARSVEASVFFESDTIVVEIVDDGIGAFENVRSSFGLSDGIEAIAELSKGKTTTDPEHHSGQGLFFSSKAVDRFELTSGSLRWIVDNRRGDYAIGTAAPTKGTRVRFEIARAATRTLRSVFDEYTTDLQFDRTRTIVRLFAHGKEFVSRSEAKRLLHGLERFREVVLDFSGVDAVGQGFADEVFRVWPRHHLEVRLLPMNMVEPVAFMVRRALAGA